MLSFDTFDSVELFVRPIIKSASLDRQVAPEGLMSYNAARTLQRLGHGLRQVTWRSI